MALINLSRQNFFYYIKIHLKRRPLIKYLFRYHFTATVVCKIINEDIRERNYDLLRHGNKEFKKLLETRQRINFAHLTDLLKEDKCYDKQFYDKIVSQISM